MGFDYIRKDRGDFDPDERLNIELMPDNPVVLFEEWIKTAVDNKVSEPYAMTLSTVDKNNKPHGRILYLRDVIDGKLVFFSNYLSAKGTEMEKSPFVSCTFFWAELSRQLRVEGEVQKADEKVSDAYFASRPRKSQIGAWASEQSSVLNEKDDLLNKLNAFDGQFKTEVPRPENWGGYLIKPDYFEFWLGQPNRLHDRVVYKKTGSEWKKYYLNP